MRAEDDVWYYKTPVGHNTLSSVVKTLYKDAGIPECKTNHQRVAALHSYQHPSERSKEIVSDIIAGTSKTHGEEIKPSLKRKMSRK